MNKLNIWLPTIKAGSGSDIYTIRLRDALKRKGINSEITWFSHIQELFPFMANGKIPHKTNIIIANSWNAFAFKHSSIPLISIVHHCVFDAQFNKYKSFAQKLYHDKLIYHYEKLSLNKSNLVIAVSQYTADSYEKAFSFKNIKVIHNWIDTDLFNVSKKKSHNNKLRLLFIGNWSKRKGSDLLPEIMQQLGKNYELICTSGMRKMDFKKPLPSNIKFVGYLPLQKSLVQLYQSADLLLFPSRLEGFGYSPLEAHACGIPVVASNSSAIPEVVKDRETGILCPVDNTCAFVDAISLLANKTEKRLEMGLKARKRAVDLFSEEITINKYIDTLKNLV